MLISPALRASRGCTYQASAQASLDAPVFCAHAAVGASNRLEEHGRQPKRQRALCLLNGRHDRRSQNESNTTGQR